MSIHIIHLTGCTPTPLANYLKALGILRLVAEQKDPNVRLWWENEHAVIASCLSRDELLQFFFEEYKPTPIIAPWNGGSGFYQESKQEKKKEKKAKQGIIDLVEQITVKSKAVQIIRDSKANRFEQYRIAIDLGKTIIDKFHLIEQPKKEEKYLFISNIKKLSRGNLQNWIEASSVILNDEVRFPSILGSGANDGNLDFSNNFMECILCLFDLNSGKCIASKDLLELSIFNEHATDGLLKRTAGMYLPNSVGGVNATSSIEKAEQRTVPWDIILTIEGTIVFSSGIVKKYNSHSQGVAVAPFTVKPAGSEAGWNDSEKERGEQWFPIWTSPTCFHEVKCIFREGRASINSKNAATASELARSIGRLGVSRGITAFERYKYLERNGKAYYAIPVGRWNVAAQAHQKVIDHAAEWLDKMERYVNGDNTSNALKSIYRSTNDAFLSVMKNASPSRWETLLIAMGELECALGASVAAKMPVSSPPPLYNLPSEWISLLPSLEQSPELRLALSLASACGVHIKDEKPELDRYNTLRGYFLPLKFDSMKWQSFCFDSSNKTEYVARTGHFIKDAISILRRKLIQMNGVFPITSANNVYASLRDISAFINGNLNDDKIWALAKPLMAISDWKSIVHISASSAKSNIPAIYSLMRLAFPTDFKKDEKLITADPTTLNQLLANNVRAAGQSAIRRLISSGLKPYIQTIVADRQLSQRIAASLLFPVDSNSLGVLKSRLCKPTLEDN